MAWRDWSVIDGAFTTNPSCLSYHVIILQAQTEDGQTCVKRAKSAQCAPVYLYKLLHDCNFEWFKSVLSI